MGLEPIKPITPSQAPGERKPDQQSEKKVPELPTEKEDGKEKRKSSPGERGYNLDIEV